MTIASLSRRPRTILARPTCEQEGAALADRSVPVATVRLASSGSSKLPLAQQTCTTFAPPMPPQGRAHVLPPRSVRRLPRFEELTADRVEGAYNGRQLALSGCKFGDIRTQY